MSMVRVPQETSTRAKRLIEQGIGSDVRFACMPGDLNVSAVLRLALEIGLTTLEKEHEKRTDNRAARESEPTIQGD